MDPLSVTMAIIGLLTAADQVSSTLQPLIKKAANAPEEIKEMKSSVDGIRIVLSQLQLMLIGKSQVGRNRTSLILVEQIVITLSACVTTFSDLDVFVETLGADANMGLLDRLRWATKTSTIQEHMQKLEVHKSTLTLMMTILTCESMRMAEDAVDMLSTTIQRVLESNILIAQRLASIEVGLGVTIQLPAALPTFTKIENIQPAPDNFQRNAQGFAFEEELGNSWVYKRSAVRTDNGAFSAISSAGRTASWSMLSGLSLADNISIIAVQALPIYEQDLSNSNIYSFGDFTGTQIDFGNANKNIPEKQSGSSKVTSETKKALKSWWARRTTPPQADAGSVDIPTMIFGVPLRRSIAYANASISLADAGGRSYIYGYLPVVVAKIGVYLKEKGTTSEDIFARNGSAVRVHELEMRFDTPGPDQNYGRKLDWTGYSVYEAATCLLRYLKRLPEPVIPYEFYDKCTSILGPTVYENDEGYDRNAFSIDVAISTLQQHIAEFPPLNRQLLLYLLDAIAVFIEKSNTNKMTSARMVAAFQPSLLAREASVGMSVLDHVRAADTLVFMIENQDHFLMGMLGTAADDTASTTADEATATSETGIKGWNSLDPPNFQYQEEENLAKGSDDPAHDTA
ncbi:hypothetical protein G7Y89_g13393 [Cudoniella acicularis]|uniref:Rho-GAP domain-containing protein n=1 Tax=Cudoniella acicularis TaxID=354080 RepID=A0A8H4VW38_9HELO|nr:hypothetical protein G7Y89_g13393 [Cudoniella acicularis]